MNTSIFEPSDEQKLLKDSIDKFLAKRYPFDARLRGTGKQVGWSREIWAELASLGILAFPSRRSMAAWSVVRWT